METTLCTTATNNIRHLGITLTEQVKELYGKNFKFLKKLEKISGDGKISHAKGLVGET